MVRLLRSYLLENRAQPDRGDTHPGQVAELGLQAAQCATSEPTTRVPPGTRGFLGAYSVPGITGPERPGGSPSDQAAVVASDARLASV